MATVDINKITLPNGDVCNLRDSTAPVLVVSKSSVSSLPTEISNGNILTDHVCPPGNMYLSNPSAQTGEWTINTNTAGKATISGSISGTTDITLYLERSR